MIGIPVVDTARLSISLLKFALFVGFSALFFGFMNDIVSILQVFLNNSFSGLSDFTSIDFGCVSTKLGLVSFLNSILAQFYIVSGFVISSVGSLLTTKYILTFFGFLMRV